MTQCLVLVHGNAKTRSTKEEWDRFFADARRSGCFRGGSEIGERIVVGDDRSARPTGHIVGFIRFDADERQTIVELLEKHPVVVHGGSVELCEMPASADRTS